jgi:hypothetical protein
MDNLFRKTAVERVSSPEQLNDYIRVSNPSIWIVLGAMIMLLASFLIWGIFGTMDTTLETSGYAKNGVVSCYLTKDGYDKVSTGVSAVKIDGNKYRPNDIPNSPLSYEAISDFYRSSPYVLQDMGIEENEWRYLVEIPAQDVADGEVDAVFIIESTHFISFILN